MFTIMPKGSSWQGLCEALAEAPRGFIFPDPPSTSPGLSSMLLQAERHNEGGSPHGQRNTAVRDQDELGPSVSNLWDRSRRRISDPREVFCRHCRSRPISTLRRQCSLAVYHYIYAHRPIWWQKDNCSQHLFPGRDHLNQFAHLLDVETTSLLALLLLEERRLFHCALYTAGCITSEVGLNMVCQHVTTSHLPRYARSTKLNTGS